MSRNTDKATEEQFDSIGLEIQSRLEELRRKRSWLAEELEISTPTLLEKMKDDSKWKKAELQTIGKLETIALWD